ncbi:TapY2 family type IVa secretion system protein [Psychromonas hadalis]|uniref:TapY2 family type IVa secretion system protein n=1 Tax=Psychromonas hadalis TaxID=211669 RepID=UPI0003B47CA9|nr:TapY2 family type IVa secretion system protein [Psychromonas hadalis]
MKTKLGLILVVGFALSTSLLAKESQRIHLKCHLQLEDKSDIVHHFVHTEKEDKPFVESLTARTVFMQDGVTEQKIIQAYECVDIKSTFKSREAVTLEENTPF